MWAAAQKHPAVVAALIKAGADVRARSRAYSQTVTSEVTQRAGREALNYTVTRGGSTPLLFAARSGDADSAGLLIEAGADVNEALPNGMTALVEAAHSGQQAVAILLLDEGRGSQRWRRRLHGAPRRRAARRPRSREGAARARRGPEPPHDEGHARPPQQRGLRAARPRSSARRLISWPRSTSRPTSCARWRPAAPTRACR